MEHFSEGIEWVYYQRLNGVFPSRKWSIKALARCKTSLYVWKRIAIYDVNDDVPSRIVNSLYTKTKYQTGTYNMHNNKKAEITCVLRHIVDKFSFAFNW